MPMPCLAAVDRREQMAHKFWAPVTDRSSDVLGNEVSAR